MGRPTPDFFGFYGPRDVVRVIRRLVEGTQWLGTLLPHLLLLGPSGLGKTTLARAIAKVLDANFSEIICSGKITPLDFAKKAIRWEHGTLVFFDEIHSLPPAVQELLMRVMTERKTLKVFAETGGRQRVTDEEIDIPPVVIIGATNQGGGLLDALSKRFLHTFDLHPYSDRDMREIVRCRASEEKILLSAQAARLLTGTCCGMPRIAGRRLTMLRLYVAKELKHHGPGFEVKAQTVRRFLRTFGIDHNGMEDIHMRYMGVLNAAAGKPVSLRALSAVLATDPARLLKDVESLLVSMGLVHTCREGRVLTEAGRAYPGMDALTHKEQKT